MSWLRELFTRRQIYRDLHEEIEEHIAQHVKALMAEGASRSAAESAARKAFGNVTRIEESGREAWLWPRTERFLRDFKFAFRKLRNSPGFALTAIVNRTFARKLFGDTPAVGQRFALWATAKYEVVGVVEDGKYGSVGEDEQPTMFLPLAQGVGEVKSSNVVVLVRSSLPRGQIAAALYRTLNNAEHGAPFIVGSWEDAVDRSMMPARAATVIVAVMGVLAAMLAVTGIFGMASYTVSKRKREQGIRVALGAPRGQVVRSVLRRPAILLLVGSAVGVGVGSMTTRVFLHLVSFATPHDPLVLAGVLITMTLLGTLAGWIPARRALDIDPAQLLRE
ncbi:MAG TPA: FtsX-like permease family protein [Terracidiphilus sp.]|jgi:ABC-type antimicrobial peptide transport system permease subunit